MSNPSWAGIELLAVGGEESPILEDLKTEAATPKIEMTDYPDHVPARMMAAKLAKCMMES